jgi:hypothetical protein
MPEGSYYLSDGCVWKPSYGETSATPHTYIVIAPLSSNHPALYDTETETGESIMTEETNEAQTNKALDTAARLAKTVAGDVRCALEEQASARATRALVATMRNKAGDRWPEILNSGAALRVVQFMVPIMLLVACEVWPERVPSWFRQGVDLARVGTTKQITGELFTLAEPLFMEYILLAEEQFKALGVSANNPTETA